MSISTIRSRLVEVWCSLHEVNCRFVGNNADTAIVPLTIMLWPS